MLALSPMGTKHSMAVGVTAFAGGIQLVALLSLIVGWIRPSFGPRATGLAFVCTLLGTTALWLVPRSGAARIVFTALTLIGGAGIVLPRWTRGTLEGLPRLALNLATLAMYVVALLILVEA